jgi:hypothetical protein
MSSPGAGTNEKDRRTFRAAVRHAKALVSILSRLSNFEQIFCSERRSFIELRGRPDCTSLSIDLPLPG